MTNDDFAKSIGAVPVDSSSDDFAKSIGAVPVGDESHPLSHNIGAGIDAVSDFAYGIPKFFAQGALAGAARLYGAATGNKATLNDTWNAAGNMINKAAPSLGSQDKVDQLPGYTVPNYPLTKLGEGINYVGDKVTDLTGSGDLGGAVKIGANFLPYHVLPGKILKTVANVKDYIANPRGYIPPEVTASDLGAIPIPDRVPQPLANQSNLEGGAGAMDNIRRQVSGSITNIPQDILNTPMERVTDTLLNGRDQTAMEGYRQADISNQQALARQVAEKDAMDRATQGIQYEQIPPDGSIPGNSPTRGITVPRHMDERWSAPDENGIPVRQDLQQVTEPTQVQNLSSDTPYANDLGNAIQEANGPKLGPDETYGSGRMYQNSQRGSSGMMEDLASGIASHLSKWMTGSPEAGRSKTYSLEEQSARKNAELQHAGPGQYITQDRDLAGVYGGPTGRAYQVHEPFKNSLDFNTSKDWGNGTKQYGDKYYKSLVDQLGSKTTANNYLKKQGYDAITFTSSRGEKIANIFNKADLTDIGSAREPSKDFGELSLAPMDTPSPAFNKFISGDRGLGRNQRGTAPMMEDLASGVAKGITSMGHALAATGDLLRKTSADLEERAAKPISTLVGKLPEDHMARVSGIKDLVYKPESGDAIVAKGLAEEKKNTGLMPNLQSGMILAGQKVNSAVLRGAGQWLNWTDKRTHLDNKTSVDPIQNKLNSLKNVDPKNYETLSKVMMREQGQRTLFSDKDLNSFLPPKGIEAYKMLRQGFNDALSKTNARLKAQGKEPIKAEEAYHASLRHGDYHQSYYDTKGNLVAHVAEDTMAGSLQAEKWYKQNFGDKIDWEKSTRWNSNEVGAIHIPKDGMVTYKQALSLIDPNNPVTTLIQDTLNKVNSDKGIQYAGHDRRFLDKNNVSGFMGDKPWKSSRENAHDFMNAQLSYLRDSNRWNNFQESLENLKPIISNPELLRNQPNIMKTVVAHVNRELGLTPSFFKEAEKALAKIVPSFGTGSMTKVKFRDGFPEQVGPMAFGRSTSNLYNFSSSLKHATYLTQLGFNPALAITVPIQSALAIAQHGVLTAEGYNHNPVATMINTLADAGAGLARHTMSSMTGKAVDTPISPFGKRLLQYAEDNGILDKTVLDESGPLNNGGILSPIKKTLGATITAPEKLSRYSTFVGFAHHLMQSGKLSEAEAMQKAEEFTNNSITSMRRNDRPIIVDKLGVTGQLAYTYKSFLFNEYNQLSQLAQMKNKGPLMVHLATLYALGGIVGLPLVNELSDGWDMIKNFMADHMPEHYPEISGLGLKGWVMKNLPTSVSMGPVSGISQTNIGTRSSSQTMDLMNPLGNIAAPVQELSELGDAGKAALHPTEVRGWENAAHINMPPLGKSMMEAHLDDYKNPNPNTPDGRNPDGTMTYVKNSDVMNPRADYNRTPFDESVRKLGMYSDTEYKTKALRYINDKEQERVNTAYRANISNAVRAFMDAKAGSSGKLVVGQNYAASALKLIPDADKFNSALEEAAISAHATPEQLDMMHAQSMATLQKIMRVKSNAN